MGDFGMRSLSEDSGSNLNHVHVESLCDTISDFLDTLDGSDFTNEELIEKRLSESEVAILESGLIVADIKNISEEIDESYISKLEHDKNELLKLFSTLDRICENVFPQLDADLNLIQELLNALELKHREFRREQSIGWIKSFLPTGALKQRDDHTKYAHQVSLCKLHPSHDYLKHFEEPVVSDTASSVTSNSETAELGEGSHQTIALCAPL